MSLLSLLGENDSADEDSPEKEATDVTDLHAGELTGVLDDIIAELLRDWRADGDMARQRTAEAIIDAYTERYDHGRTPRDSHLIDESSGHSGPFHRQSMTAWRLWMRNAPTPSVTGGRGM